MTASLNDPPIKTTNPPAKRRRFALSLRAYMVVVLVVGTWISWVGYKTRVQMHAVERIRKAGGAVSYDWEWRGIAPLRPSEPPVPQWMIDKFGPDFFGYIALVALPIEDLVSDDLITEVARFDRLEYLAISAKSVTDAGLARLQGLTRLKTLWLHNSGITGDGLRHVAKMRDLENLSFPQGSVKDADLAYLAGLTKLKEIELTGNQITDAGLVHLGGLTHLERLELKNTKVTDLTPIRGLTRLNWLNVQGSPLNDKAIEPIAAFRDLQDLNLGQTDITDKALSFIVNLPKLESLSLNQTRLTDVGLAQLGRLSNLKLLDVQDTSVTDAGLAAFAEQPMLQTCKTLFVGRDVTASRLGAIRAKFPNLEVAAWPPHGPPPEPTIPPPPTNP